MRIQKILAFLLIGCLSALRSAEALSSKPKSVAVLPLLPEQGADPREGWALSVKMISKMDGGLKVHALDWTDLSELMEAKGLDKKGLRDPAVLKKLGEHLKVDSVLSGRFSVRGKQAFYHPRLTDVRSGKSVWAREQRVARDVVVAVPQFKIEPPVLDPENALAMRDAPSDYEACAGAGERVDAMENQIMDLKARYWALQLSRGVSYKGIKYNPGSTISDPFLRKAFYGRMKAWMKQDVIPELTPHETIQFAQIDEEAFRLARSCGIL